MLAPLHAGAAPASLPQRMWLNVDRLALDCRIEGATRHLNERVCARLAHVAKQRSPYPVTVAPASPRDVSLRLEGEVRPSPDGRSGAVSATLRAHRIAIEHETDSVSGPVPVSLPLDAADDRIDAALAAALDRVLPGRTDGPWRQR